jgi:hypothetical protein
MKSKLLDSIKKAAFGTDKEDKTMTTKNVTEPVKALEAVAPEVFAALQAEVVEKDTQLSALAGKVAELEKSLTQFAEAKAALEKEIQAKRLETRKNVIVEAVGTAKADALLAATDSLDDAAFTAVVSALGMSMEAEAKTPAFKEVGVDAKADAVKVDEQANSDPGASLAKKLEQKYHGAK